MPSAAASLSGPAGEEERRLIADPRFQEAVRLFNAADWYACHDGFEELWHETQGPMRPVLQGLLQIAVAELHGERGNSRGATVLMGEGLGRLRGCGPEALGLAMEPLRHCAQERLMALQAGQSLLDRPRPCLEPVSPQGR
jgi:predicted metal-dependent hydrolase